MGGWGGGYPGYFKLCMYNCIKSCQVTTDGRVIYITLYTGKKGENLNYHSANSTVFISRCVFMTCTTQCQYIVLSCIIIIISV